MNLLTRDEFKNKVFKRDKHKCVNCFDKAVDAHHLIERKLFNDGGYYLDNGVSLCEKCHLLAEATILSVEELRSIAKISSIIIPHNFEFGKTYDKWGNVIENDSLIPGPLFNDLGCQKMLALKKKLKR